MDSTLYDPVRTLHRQVLAQRLLTMLGEAGFIEAAVRKNGTRERVFYHMVDGVPGVRVVVYTTIEGYGDLAEVRLLGKDAIRVCAVYRSQGSKSDRGIVSGSSIFRTGTMEAICSRTLNKMREVYAKVRGAPTCNRCGAPTFVSKNENVVCAEVCFTRPQVQVS